jgi:hypothetical protein
MSGPRRSGRHGCPRASRRSCAGRRPETSAHDADVFEVAPQDGASADALLGPVLSEVDVTEVSPDVADCQGRDSKEMGEPRRLAWLAPWSIVPSLHMKDLAAKRPYVGEDLRSIVRSWLNPGNEPCVPQPARLDRMVLAGDSCPATQEVGGEDGAAGDGASGHGPPLLVGPGGYPRDGLHSAVGLGEPELDGTDEILVTLAGGPGFRPDDDGLDLERGLPLEPVADTPAGLVRLIQPLPDGALPPPPR